MALLTRPPPYGGRVIDAFPDFVWSIGEEGSDPIVMRNGERYRQDQFAMSGHDENMERDLFDIGSLGVKVVRYGTPWRIAEPRPGEYDWSRWDRALAACDAAGVEPIVEFLHFGLPDHYPGFVDTAWIDGFGRYVDAFLARYPGPRWFTPINEPGVTALMSARLGVWNDMLKTREAHAQALANVVLANLEAMARIRSDRGGWWIGSEGFDVPVSSGSRSDDELVERRRARNWLVWDLHFGRKPQAPVADYMASVDDETLARIRSLAFSDRLVAGLDLYPISVQPVSGERPDWSVEELIDLATAEIERWDDHYNRPFWIAETSNLTLPLDQQIPWLDTLSDRLGRMRSAGRPARGLCWYSRGDQFDWQTALSNPVGAVTEVGLLDVDRSPRPIAQRFTEISVAPPIHHPPSNS
jgi:hypothetical protein